MDFRKLFILVLLISILFSCGNKQKKETQKPKYVFYFIGDGYGQAQAHLAEIYLAHQKGSVKPETLLMNTFPTHGMYRTYAHNRTITGSAAAGTALSSGYKTSINTICMSPDHAQSYKSIAEFFRDQGKKIGIVTSVSIDHATPAVFYAHKPSRHDYYHIALDLPKSGFNYFAGGGFKDPFGLNVTKKVDEKSNMGIGGKGLDYQKDSLPSVFDNARKEGYRFVQDRDAFNDLKVGDDKVVVFSQRPSEGMSMPYVIDQNEYDFTLVDYTRKGIELLDNPKGFFMMIEGGKIDWACHANDAASTVLEVLQFDQAVEVAYDFYKKHPQETLIVICSDHETGGLSLGWSGTHYQTNYHLLKMQQCSNQVFTQRIKEYKAAHSICTYEDIYPLLKSNFGFDTSEDMQLQEWEIKALKKAIEEDCKQDDKEAIDAMEKECAYGSYNPIAIEASRILAHKSGLSWTTFSHTAMPCPARAIGVGAESFYGAYDNTDLPKKILEVCDK